MGFRNEQENPLDVSRESVVRLLRMAQRNYLECVDRSYAQTWWEGYIRCCEQMLEMENE